MKEKKKEKNGRKERKNKENTLTHTKQGSDKFNLLKIRDKVTQINFNNLL